MKKLLYILLFCVLPFVVSAQLGLNNNTVTISSTGTIQADSVKHTVVVLQPNEIDFSYAHSNQSFKDSAITITGGTNVQITNASGSGDFTITSSSVYFEQYYAK